MTEKYLQIHQMDIEEQKNYVDGLLKTNVMELIEQKIQFKQFQQVVDEWQNYLNIQRKQIDQQNKFLRDLLEKNATDKIEQISDIQVSI